MRRDGVVGAVLLPEVEGTLQSKHLRNPNSSNRPAGEGRHQLGRWFPHGWPAFTRCTALPYGRLFTSTTHATKSQGCTPFLIVAPVVGWTISFVQPTLHLPKEITVSQSVMRFCFWHRCSISFGIKKFYDDHFHPGRETSKIISECVLLRMFSFAVNSSSCICRASCLASKNSFFVGHSSTLRGRVDRVRPPSRGAVWQSITPLVVGAVVNHVQDRHLMPLPR